MVQQLTCKHDLYHYQALCSFLLCVCLVMFLHCCKEQKKNKVKDRTVKEEEELYLAYCVFNSSRVTSVVISLVFPSTTMKGLIGSPPILQICPGKNYLPSDILLNLYHLRSLFNPSALHYLPHYTECTHIHKSLWWPHVTQVKTSCVHSLRALRAFIQPLIAHILSSQAFIFGFT